ncbi:hypothetical protein CRE_15043 [Caenorhabditis remanei]|uniref:Uncharacterized protein n=1 Tax=Caenorhabditis remanei TaxID=31234 RepID=E3NKB2_CAERE|nr:hypothetical protein CRE_15043 [Caenorhabditis remanei]
MFRIEDEECSQLFTTATECVNTVVDLKRNGQMIKEKDVEELVKKLKAEEMNFSFIQQQSAGAAIIISARIVLPGSKKFFDLEALVPLFIQALEMVSSFEKLEGFRWRHVHPLFQFYVEEIPNHSGAQHFLELLQKIMDVMKLSPTVNDDFFSYNNSMALARLIVKMNEIINNQDGDLEIRKRAVVLLHSMVKQCPPERASTVSLYSSGLCTAVAKLLKGGTNIPSLIKSALLLFKDLVILVFADNAVKLDTKTINWDEYIPQVHNYLRGQTEEWRTTGSEHIQQCIRDSLSSYMNHRSWDVKLAVCEMTLEIQEACKDLLKEKLYGCLMSLYIHLRYDQSTQFQEIGKKALELVKNKRKAEEFFYQQLDIHISRLPVRTHNEDGLPEINIVSAILTALGDSVRLLSTTGSRTMEALLKSLADSIVIDKRKIMITSDVAIENIEQALRKMKLQYDVTHSAIAQICQILADLGGIEVVDMVHNLMRMESPGKRASYHIILAHLLSSLKTSDTPSDDPIILMLAEYLVLETNRSCIIKLKEDTKPESHQFEIDWSTCVESLSLTNLALCMRFIGQTVNRSHISTQCLCTVLMQTTSQSWIVSESAQFALKIIAEESSRDQKKKDDPDAVERLIRRYSSHILNRVSLACTSSTNYHMAPILFQSYLAYGEIPDHFNVFKVIVEKMLYALDRNQQQYSYSLLQALLFFMGCMNRDYPNHEPLSPPKDSEDEKDLPTPQHIIVEQILLRTKHMLSSEHIPVKIIVLRLLSQGIEFMKLYDDMLLPMIHQNWFGLMAIAKELEPNTLGAVIDRVVDMAEKSGTFVHNKILKEFWPLVETYFMKQISRREEFSHTSEFAVTTRFINSIPRIIANAGITEKEAKKTFMKIINNSIENKGKFAFYCDKQKKIIDAYYKEGKSVYDE